MATAKASRRAPERDLWAEAVDLYRDMLTGPAAVPPTEWEPVRIGPAWKINPLTGRWLLPERTLGWDGLYWTHAHLQHEGEPWVYSPEQARLVLWWYAVDEVGRFVYRHGVIQRLKGWGKDPFAATLCAIEAVGPCRWSGTWNEHGQPIPIDNPAAWIQLTAVAESQNANTMMVFPGLFTEQAKKTYDIQIQKTVIWFVGSSRKIEARATAPRSMEGNRPTFVLKNETHHWLRSNDGHEMDGVIARNSAKGGNRTLAITNAYEPGEDSVAERRRDHIEKVAAGTTVDVGYLYDTVEAPPEAPLTAEAAPGVIRSIRGDSVWLDPANVLGEVLDSETPPSQARRWWYNQITAAEDAWTSKQEWESNGPQYHGLPIETPGDEIVAFFDGSKSDDATALVGCRVEDGYTFSLGCWQKPHGWDEKNQGRWLVPRDEVSTRVREMRDTYRVHAFLCDPGSGEDDETGERFWDPIIDIWATWFDRLTIEATTGNRRHRLLWDMRTITNQAAFADGTGRALADILAKQLPHDGGRRMQQHVLNARRRPGKYGVAVGKEHRESSRKIDLAVCVIGARMARWRLLNSVEWKKRKSPGRGRVLVLS